MEKIKKHHLKIAAVFLLIIGLFLGINVLSIDLYIFNWLENGIYNLIAPFLNLVESISSTFENFFLALFRSHQLIEENEKLRERVSELSASLAMMEDVRRQNQRLRELLNYQNYLSGDAEVITGRVVGYSPASWQRKAIINLGENQDLEKNQPVIGYNGNLIGRVETPGMNSSQIITLADPEFAVGGQIVRDESRALGLIRGIPDDDSHVMMENIPWDADVKVGDKIMTSGVSENYPPGLPIGEVVKVEAGKLGLSQVVKIDAHFGSRNLEEVLILKNW